MRLSSILKEESEKSNGNFIIREVPKSKQPSVKTINRLEREIKGLSKMYNKNF